MPDGRAAEAIPPTAAGNPRGTGCKGPAAPADVTGRSVEGFLTLRAAAEHLCRPGIENRADAILTHGNLGELS